MINLFVGTVPQGSPFSGRYCLLLDGPDMHAKYTRDGTALDTGRMLNNDEEEVYDSELGVLERTGITMQVIGQGRVDIGAAYYSDIDCSLKSNLRFYRIPPKKV